MSKPSGEKTVVTRVTRSLRNRVVSIDNDVVLRPPTSVKNDLEPIAEDEVKKENNSPSTPVQMTKYRKRRSSQSEANITVITPSRKLIALKRRSSFSELENTPGASPLRRSARKISSCLEEPDTMQGAKSPASVNVILEEKEEEQKSKSPSRDIRITRSSSKSPKTTVKKRDAVGAEDISSSNQNNFKQLSKSSTSTSKNINLQTDNTTKNEKEKVFVEKEMSSQTTIISGQRVTRMNSESPKGRPKIARLICVEQDVENKNLYGYVDKSISDSPKSRRKENRVEESREEKKLLNVSDEEFVLNNTESTTLPASPIKSPERETKETAETVTENSAANKPLNTNNTTINAEKVIPDDISMDTQNTCEINEKKKYNYEKVKQTAVDKNCYDIEKKNYKMSDLPTVEIITETDDSKIKTKQMGSELENETICNTINIEENSTKNMEKINKVDDRKEGDEIDDAILHNKESTAEIISDQVDDESFREIDIIKTGSVRTNEIEEISKIENCNQQKKMELMLVDDNNSNNHKKSENANIPVNETSEDVQNIASTISKKIIEDIPQNSENANKVIEAQSDKLAAESNEESYGSSNNELQESEISNIGNNSKQVVLENFDCSMNGTEKEVNIASDNRNQGSKEKSVVFNTTEGDDKITTIYPKTPIFSKSKSCIEDEPNVSVSVDLRSNSKISSLMNDSNNLNCQSVEDTEKFDIDPICTVTEDTQNNESKSVDTPYQKAKQSTISSSTPIVNLKAVRDEVRIEEQEVPIQSLGRQNLSLRDTQNRDKVNDYGFSKSWSQAIIGKAIDTNKGISFIDGFDVNTEKCETKNKTIKGNGVAIIRSNTDEEDSDIEKEENESEKNEFIDDEAMEVEDYQEHDSMDSEERDYLMNNEVPICGESIGSQDTEDLCEGENFSEEGEEEEDENESFIVSSSEEDDKSIDSGELYSDNSLEANTSKNSKNNSRKVIFIDTSDDENETKDKNSEVRPSIKENKRISRRAVIIESSDEESEIAEVRNNHDDNDKNSAAEIETHNNVQKEINLRNLSCENILNKNDSEEKVDNNEREPKLADIAIKDAQNVICETINNSSELVQECPEINTNTKGKANSEIVENIPKNSNSSNTGTISRESHIADKSSNNQNIPLERRIQNSNLQNVNECLNKSDSKNHSDQQSTDKNQKVGIINSGNLENVEKPNIKQISRDLSPFDNVSTIDCTPEAGVVTGKEKNEQSMKEISTEILRTSGSAKDSYENLDNSKVKITNKNNTDCRFEQIIQKVVTTETVDNENESEILNEEGAQKETLVSENLNVSINKIKKPKTNSICKKTKITKTSEEELLCSENHAGDNAGHCLSISFTSNTIQSIKKDKRLSSSFTILSKSSTKQGTESNGSYELIDKNTEQEHILNISKNNDEIFTDSSKTDPSDSTESEGEIETNEIIPSHINNKFQKTEEIIAESIEIEGLNNSCKEVMKREKQLWKEEAIKSNISIPKSTLKKGIKKGKITEIQSIETENAKLLKPKKVKSSFSIQNILTKCDEILEATNKAKKEAKNTNSAVKVKKAKQKKLKKEYENISPTSNQLLQTEAKEIARAVEYGKNLLKKNIKKYIQISNQDLKETLSTPENAKELNFFEEKSNLKKQKNNKHTVSNESVQDSSDTNYKKQVKKRKLQISETSDEERNANYRKGLNFIKNSSGIFVEETVVTPPKKFKITSTLELPTGIVYEQPITPTSKVTGGFKETEATPNPKTLGFKVKNILNAGQKQTPITKQERAKKRKLNFPEPVSVLPKPKWTRSGDFSVSKLDRVDNTNFIPLNLDESTDFVVAPLQSKRFKTKGSGGLGPNTSAVEFKINSLYNKKINRGTSKELLQRTREHVFKSINAQCEKRK